MVALMPSGHKSPLAVVVCSDGVGWPVREVRINGQPALGAANVSPDRSARVEIRFGVSGSGGGGLIRARRRHV
ncbi:MAG: hypothetical protein N2652_10635 [Kiritimatiellae bacterium]|nr:hypothetical protein [Kiritimatiellia bacterium]